MDFKHTWFCLGNDSLLTPFLKMFMCAEREIKGKKASPNNRRVYEGRVRIQWFK